MRPDAPGQPLSVARLGASHRAAVFFARGTPTRTKTESGTIDCFEGEHDGYRTLGIKHRRKVQWLPGAGWVIVDDILGAGVHDARLHWLAADFPYEASDSPFHVSFISGELQVSWNVFAS